MKSFHWPTSPKVWCALAVAASVCVQQVNDGQYQSAMMTLASILALLGLGGQVGAALKTSEANKADLTDIRQNPVMPGTYPDPLAPRPPALPPDNKTIF